MTVITHIHGKDKPDPGRSPDLVLVVQNPNYEQIANVRIVWNNVDDPFDIKISVSTQFDVAGVEVSSNTYEKDASTLVAVFETCYVDIIPLVAINDEENEDAEEE